MDACTIIAKNYLAQARVLARSFAEHHPGGRFWTLIIDDFADAVDPAQEPFEILSPADVGVDEFLDMAFRYTVLELSTAVKPWLLRHLMDRTGGPITYLDPDIQVFAPLDRLDELARSHHVVLTPHCTVPIPHDGRRPTQIDIMIAGIYNLGYLSLAPSAEIDQVLGWWEERLRRDCRVDPVYGYFVDQRWFDLVPGLVAAPAIVRDPEYNVAYWNLQSRQLRRGPDGYTVDGRPLGFFHFSGFDPNEPEVLSRHQDRIRVADEPALAEILREYANDVLEAGYVRTRHLSYSFDRLPDGTRLDPIVRQLFADAEESGELTESPLTPARAAALQGWLAEQSPGAPQGVNRLLARLYGVRGDLRERYPDIGGADLAGFLEWARTSGAVEVPMLARLPALEAPAAPAPSPRPRTAEQPRLGVNVAGHFRSELGIGEVARQAIAALDATRLPAVPVRVKTTPESRQGHEYSVVDEDSAPFPVNLICVNADMLPDFASNAGSSFFEGRYSIGLWFWEVSQFRAEWRESFDLVDEVWAPSTHIADALAPVSPIPVVPVTVPVEMPAIVPRSRASLGLPEGFLLLFSFDYLSVFERKNPLAVVEAFRTAFPDDELGARLVIKCINAERDPANHRRLVEAAASDPRVQVIDRYLDPADKDTLMALCDCYVSLHRAEGFGLTMAEAMYLGKPLIATGYSGNLDFMNDENSLLVDWTPVAIGPGLPPYPASGEWADPDVEQAASLMRRLAGDRELCRGLGARAAESIRRTNSPVVVGDMMRARLERLELLDGVSAASAKPISSVDRLLSRGPVAPAESRGAAQRFARRGVLRTIRPFTAYQRDVNKAVADSLGALAGELGHLSRREVSDEVALERRVRSLERLNRLPAVLDARGHSLDEISIRVAELEHAARAGRWHTDRGIYLALDTLRARHAAISETPASGARGALTPFELRVFSQNGEDGVIAEILARTGVGPRYFVEFGIESGREGNSVSLADVFGWSGLFIEGDEAWHRELERKYRGNDRVATMNAMVTPENVEQLFASAGVPDEPGLLSIDVDGGDYWIWEALDAYRPRVLVIEYNSELDPARRLVQPREVEGWDGTEYFGASLGAMSSLGASKGYRLVHTELSGVNAFFVREDLAGERFPSLADVPVRGRPNYFQSGEGHPPDPLRRGYLDLDSEELTDPRTPGD